MGYINYEPSYNPFKGSHVILFNFSDDLKPLPKSERKLNNELLFEQVSEQALNKSCTSSGTGTEQALVPSINYINNTNISNKKNVSNLDKQAKKIIARNEEISEDELLKNEAAEEKKEKSSAKKEKDKIKNSDLSSRAQSRELNPTTEEVKTYFQQNNFPELEAQKFFNYFSSVGWLVGGKTPMVDWQAAAQNWILNSINFNNNTDTTPSHPRQNLNATTDKNYAEPL